MAARARSGEFEGSHLDLQAWNRANKEWHRALRPQKPSPVGGHTFSNIPTNLPKQHSRLRTKYSNTERLWGTSHYNYHTEIHFNLSKLLVQSRRKNRIDSPFSMGCLPGSEYPYPSEPPTSLILFHNSSQSVIVPCSCHFSWSALSWALSCYIISLYLPEKEMRITVINIYLCLCKHANSYVHYCHSYFSIALIDPRTRQLDKESI